VVDGEERLPADQEPPEVAEPREAALDYVALREWTEEHTGIELEVVYPWWRYLKRYCPDTLEELGFEKGSHVLPRRGVVERTFAWLGRYRRLSKDL
jgi:hypothetical protein